MSYITIDDLRKYTGSYDEDNATLQICINSAEQIINDYVGFQCEPQEYSITLSGIGTERLLVNYPIQEITELYIDDVEQSVDEYSINGRWIIRNDGRSVFTEGINNIRLTFVGGYTDIPDIFKLTALRIAALLALESQGNIGITNKSFADGSRTFINYTNFNKYLAPLDRFKVARF